MLNVRKIKDYDINDMFSYLNNFHIQIEDSFNLIKRNNNFKVKNSYKSGKLFDNDCAKDFISYVNILFKGKFSQIALYRLISKSKYKSILTDQAAASRIFKNSKYIILIC